MKLVDNIEILPYDIAYEQELDIVKRLYEGSFPLEERRDWKKFLHLLDTEPRFRLLLIQKNSLTIGFLSSWHFETFIYGEHFAIAPQERGSGIGRKLIAYLWNLPRKEPWVFEVEHPNTDIATRRLNFYLSLGAEILDKEYLQPPYHEGQDTFPLYFMGTGADPSQTKFYIDNVRRVVYGKA